AGDGFALIGVDIDPAALATAARTAPFARLDPALVLLTSGQPQPVAPSASPLLSIGARCFAPPVLRAVILLVRPDRYVLAAFDPPNWRRSVTALPIFSSLGNAGRASRAIPMTVRLEMRGLGRPAAERMDDAQDRSFMCCRDRSLRRAAGASAQSSGRRHRRLQPARSGHADEWHQPGQHQLLRWIQRGAARRHGAAIPALQRPQFDNRCQRRRFRVVPKSTHQRDDVGDPDIGRHPPIRRRTHAGIRRPGPRHPHRQPVRHRRHAADRHGTALGDVTFGPYVQFRPVMQGRRPVASIRLAVNAIAPTGGFDRSRDLNQGSGYWSINPYVAWTVLPAPGWEVSGRTQFLHNFRTSRIANPPPIPGFHLSATDRPDSSSTPT
ncbi:hypothetical protein U1Q18_052356, partial [Sarracenia purpurea var. burkii]